ncbi:MAG: antibiotic biosynthesis monooxygenase [Devosia sp.]|nr:antibiotic biosynthesis monooxygenase [Devosia sp.]
MDTKREVLAVFAHPVKDYTAWRKVFDASAPMQKAMGIIGVEVFQDPNDPNKVIVIDRYPDMATMERYLANPQLKEAMTQAGVTTPPTILIGLAT